MKTLLRLMAFIVLAATPAFSYAQLRSYSCDFEDTAECTLWHIENFHDTVSFTGWRIGSTPGNTSCSLYIDIDPSIGAFRATLAQEIVEEVMAQADKMMEGVKWDV